MIIVTNRNLQPKKNPKERFGPHFNTKGPQELRLAEASKIRGKWKMNVVEDRIKQGGKGILASEYVFRKLQDRMRRYRRNCLFFVHGFNNDFKDVIERANFLEQKYRLELVVFTWPSNGGGIKGVLSYKSDKREAQLSVNALDRIMERLSEYMLKHRDTACQQSFNLMMHSMGNYLFKNLLKSSVYNGESLLFDNIVMAAADVNNKNHQAWVDKIAFRKRLYITINENDNALFSSRLKFGQKQLARLGHYSLNLCSKHARYIDFSSAAHVGSSHAYFEDALRNRKVFRVFNSALNGKKAEAGLRYNTYSNSFMV